jgi:hypothetical protein
MRISASKEFSSELDGREYLYTDQVGGYGPPHTPSAGVGPAQVGFFRFRFSIFFVSFFFFSFPFPFFFSLLCFGFVYIYFLDLKI